MDGNIALSSIRRLLENGQTVTLRRDPATDVSVKASVRECVPTELVGDIRQGDRRCIISNEEIVAAAWPGPPSRERKDRVVIDGKVFTIIECDTRKVSDVVVGHWMVIRG